MKKQGVVYLVGAGPGDPGLITRTGLRHIRECEVIVYDYLSSDCLLEEIKKGCECIYVGKQAGKHSMKQEQINQVLIEQAKAGKTVVRLKGGDPFVFGRGGEEVLALQKEAIPYEVIPGVTSAVSALCAAGIPITHRGISRSFHVMTGHTLAGNGSLPEDFDSFAALSGTLVFLMGLGSLPTIREGLIRNGKDSMTPAAVIENGTLPEQRVVKGTLNNIVELVEQEKLHTPAIIVVGEVVSLNMISTIPKPLRGIRIGISGTATFTTKLASALEAYGAMTQVILKLEVESYVDSQPMCCAYENLKKYTWVLFTSPNGVHLFFQGLMKHGMDGRAMGHMKLATVGKGTSEILKQYGFIADYVPETYCTEALAKGLSEILTSADTVLIPRGAGGSKELTQILAESKIKYDDIVLYDVLQANLVASDCVNKWKLEEQMQDLDYMTFASASGVRSFFEEAGEDTAQLLKSVKTVCIGAVTAAALRAYKIEPNLIAASYTANGLAEIICGDVKKEMIP